jgi:endonuclease-3 related protein
MASKKHKIKKIHASLNRYFGDLGWWPADSRFEVIVGAILTQNTAWTNVEKAITELKRNKLMSPKAIARRKSGEIKGDKPFFAE